MSTGTMAVRSARSGERFFRDQTDPVIGAAIEVHRVLGPGLLEETYESCLCHELHLRDVAFQRQVHLPIVYKGIRLASAYRIDLVVNDFVIVELKAVEQILPLHEAQLLTYLRHTGKRVGLLINFNVPILKNGIRRRVL
ncbi:MAG: GxxExxY protein [Terriglobales bacterium]